jgi:hypothetical protein
MAAYLTINFNGSNKEIIFHIGEKPKEKYQGIKPEHIEEIQLDGDELAHAITNLGAAVVQKRVVTYFGDEAKRIFFNW